MMNAREIFEQLGYERTEDEARIEYENEDELIIFYKERERLYHVNSYEPLIYLGTFKAIHQQLKELGWIDNE